MKLKRFACFIVVLTSICTFFGCSSENNESSSGSTSVSSNSNEQNKNDEAKKTKNKDNKKLLSFVNYTAVVDNQLAPPKNGEEIAVLNVKDYGTIKCRLFPELAPKAVENFKELAKRGKYKDVPFHRVIKDFMIQTGGEESYSIYDNDVKKGFEVELSQSLRHLNGALCMASTGDLKCGQANQFYIVSSEVGKTKDLKKVEDTTRKINAQKQYDIYPTYTEKDKKNYETFGGYPALDMNYTVFGQVFEGLDVVKKIADCKISQEAAPNGEKCIPETEILLENVEIVKI